MAGAELLLVVEYCCNGNLHTYLINQRMNFINHVDQFGKYLIPDEYDDDKKHRDDFETCG